MAPISKDVIAAAAAHGLSTRVVGTWHPDLPRTPRVLVPIQLDALVVRESGRTFADCRMRAPTDEDPDPAPAAALLPAPFTDESAPRPRGVYLHWALPDGLAHGIAANDGSSVSFPAIPDRWLVLRLSPGTSPLRRAVRGWMIEGGRAEPRVTALDEWTEPGDNPPDVRSSLTALGHGDPAWSGYFANVVNRLAFYDNLDGVANGPLGYLVCGWHSKTSDDPIGEGLPSLDAFQQRLHDLGWELAPGDLDEAMREAQRSMTTAALVGLETREARFTARADQGEGSASARARTSVSAIARFGDAPLERAPVDRRGIPDRGRYLMPAIWWPQHTLYHGAVVGLGWPGAGIPVAHDGLLGSEVGGPPSAGAVRISLGNTMTEALAALIADNNGTARDGRVLEAALLGATDELDEPDGTARLDVRLHANGFGALSAGETTEIISQRPLATPPVAHVPDPSKVDPGVFRGVRDAGGQVSRPLGTGRALSETLLNVSGSVAGTPRANALHISGTLLEGVAQVSAAISEGTGAGTPAGAPDEPPVDTEVSRTLPRRFVPPDPVILLEGAKRSFKHGHDGMHAESGRLLCRITGHTVTQIAPRRVAEVLGDATIGGEDLLERGAENGSIPPECESLLREIALLDPGSADVVVRLAGRGHSLTGAQLAQHATTVAVEQMAWWVARDPRRDVAPLTAVSGIEGVLPSPMAISPPTAPWVPLHLDWEAEYIASPGGVRDWALHEVDFDARPEVIPEPDAELPAQVIAGRALLTAGAARTAASAVRRTIEQAERSGGSVKLRPGIVTRFQSPMAQTLVTALHEMRAGAADAGAGDVANELDHLADELERLDVLSGALDNFHTSLRGGFLGDGFEVPPAGAPRPDPFVGVRAGYLRFRRLRLVDCFGQVLYLAGSNVDGGGNTSQIVRSEPLTVQGRPDLIELAPRFTSPARLWFRFVDASDDSVDASAGAEHSPLCGFVLPNHLDGDLQFHAGDGSGIGAVRPRAGVGIVWEDAPGRPTTIGKSPLRAIDNAHVAQLGQALLDWGVVDTTPGEEGAETALAALLRIIDSTLWTVDPFGHVGDEHLSLLVAHPIAVMRAKIRLEVQEPIDDATVKGVRLPVRVGALAHWNDGLLGYFVNDDYHTLCVPDPACAKLARPIGPHDGFLQQATATSSYYEQFAEDIGVVAVDGATPVDHAYVDSSGVLWVQPNQDVWLTLLMEPHSVVHATSGLLPRKEIGMRREWIAKGLARLAPVFRFGPVLVDPKRIRMPVASDIRGTWSWSHRVDPTTWADEPVVNATGDAQVPQDRSVGQEGWLKLTPPDESQPA